MNENRYFRVFTLYNNYKTSYVINVSEYEWAFLKQTLNNSMRPHEITMLRVTFYDNKYGSEFEAHEFLKSLLEAGELIDKEL